MIGFVNLWIFLLLPLPWLVRKILTPVIFKHDAGLKVPFYSQLSEINQVTHSQKKSSAPLFCAYFVWVLLLIACAGPEWLGKPVDLPRSGRDILLAIDLSGSMQIPDMELNNKPTNRITVVKHVAQEFIENRKGDRLGLILFGSRAYLETPLTFDLKTVKDMLLDATVGLAGTQTAMGDAIGMAIKHLHKYPQKDKVLILLTDGVNNEGSVMPLDAAKLAAQYGIKIYTIGLGANQITIPFLGTQFASSDYDLDEDTLKSIANITHGLYFRVTNSQDLVNVYKNLNQIEPRLGEKEVLRPKTPLYYWPLGLAFVIVILMMVRQQALI